MINNAGTCINNWLDKNMADFRSTVARSDCRQMLGMDNVTGLSILPVSSTHSHYHYSAIDTNCRTQWVCSLSIVKC